MHRPGAGAIIVRWRSSPATSSWNARRFWTRWAARSRTRSPAAAGSCSSQARAASGKTAVVRAFATPPAAGGPCAGAPAIRSPRRCRWRRSLDLAAARSRRLRSVLAQAVHRARGVRGAPGRAGRRRRPCSSSRTCTGPTRRRSTSCGSSAAASPRCRCSPSSRTATSAAAPVDPLRVALGDLAGASGVSRISVEPLSPDAVRHACRRPRGRLGRARTAARPATRSTCTRCSRPATTACRRPSATP